MRRGWKITGLVALIVLGAAVLVGAGYAVATWQNQSSHVASTSTNGNGNNTSNNTNGNNNESNTNTPVTPVKPTQDITCNADELGISTANTDAPGAGTLALKVVLTNKGTRNCNLSGFPGVSLVNDNGNQIGKPAVRATNYTNKTVLLTPGTSTAAIVTYSLPGNFDPGTCVDGATKLRVYPPNDTGYLSVAETAIQSWCPGYETSPVQQQ